MVSFSWVVTAKNDNAKDTGSDKSKSAQSMGQVKDYQKPDKSKGETNASLHQQKIGQVSTDLNQAAKNEKEAALKIREEKTNQERVNNPEVGQQVENEKKNRERVAEELTTLAEETQAVEDETNEALEELEKEGRWKTFLVGTNYKNLGQMRSSLAHYENQIRSLQRLMVNATPESQAEIQAAIDGLEAERTRIREMVQAKEGQFSLLGWMFRLINGYSSDDETDPEASPSPEVSAAPEVSVSPSPEAEVSPSPSPEASVSPEV